MSPAELQHVTFAAVRSLLAKLVSRGPTVLALEDLHWSDPTSLRLTAELASLASNGPLLVLVTRRPEPDPGVGELEAALAQRLGAAPAVARTRPIQRPMNEPWRARSWAATSATRYWKPSARAWTATRFFLEERVASLTRHRCTAPRRRRLAA